MNKRHIIIIILTILPILFTLIALPFMPDTIPAHYGFNGQVDRIGSKYELLLFLIGPVLMYITFYFSMKYEIKNKDTKKILRCLKYHL